MDSGHAADSGRVAHRDRGADGDRVADSVCLVGEVPVIVEPGCAHGARHGEWAVTAESFVEHGLIQDPPGVSPRFIAVLRAS